MVLVIRVEKDRGRGARLLLYWRSFGAHLASTMPCGSVSAIGNENITCGTQLARI